MVVTRWRRWASWLALWALVWHAAFAPALAHAAASAAVRGEAIEICSSTGVVTLVLPSAASGAPDAPAFTVHCDWCQTHGADWALPATARAAEEPVAGGAVAPSPASAAPGAARWALPSPRGPPLPA